MKARSTGKTDVTIILPVYNAEKYLAESIESVLRQTYKHFKLLIVDDKSTDKSLKIAKELAAKDARIEIVERKKNIGLIGILNESLCLVKTEYVARQDADDAWYDNKLEMQMAYLSTHPKVGMIAGAAEYTDEFGRFDNIDPAQVFHEDIVRTMLVRNFFPHSGVVIRKSVLDKCGNYSKSALHAEDYDLWMRISQIAEIYNLPQPIMRVRLNTNSVTGQNQVAQDVEANRLRDWFWEEVCPAVLTSKEIKKRMQKISGLETKPGYYKDSLIEDFLATNIQIAKKMYRCDHKARGLHQLFCIWRSGRRGRRMVYATIKQRTQ